MPLINLSYGALTTITNEIERLERHESSADDGYGYRLRGLREALHELSDSANRRVESEQPHSSPAPQGEQLWSDDDIGREVYTLALGYKARHVLKRIRDEYQAALDQRDARIAALEQQLAKTIQDDDPEEKGFVGTVDWVGPSGKAWKMDLYQDEDGDDE